MWHIEMFGQTFGDSAITEKMMLYATPIGALFVPTFRGREIYLTV